MMRKGSILGLLCLASTVMAGGTVSGTVKFDGNPPAAAAKTVPADHNDKKSCGVGDSVPDESLVVDTASKGIANAVVTLEPKEGKAAPAAGAKVVFDQKHCVFPEHVTVIPVGAEVEFKNSDTVAHNIKLTGTLNPSFNETVDGGKQITKKFGSADRMKVECSIHPWMSSYLVSVDTPYYAKTDAKGGFKIENIPAGTYKVKVWQETLGGGGKTWNGPKEITVKDGETAAADFKGAPKQ